MKSAESSALLFSIDQLCLKDMTPQSIVQELDKHVIGQAEAKRAVANAVRNRMRRLKVPEVMRKEISPKNILMIGSTGIGKTEIARRLATLVEAPFVKVEATKFTEVGYVGKDVDTIIRDLVEDALVKVRKKAYELIKEEAHKRAVQRVLELLRTSCNITEDDDSDEYKDFVHKFEHNIFDEYEIECESSSAVGIEIMVPHGMEEVSQQLQNLFQSVHNERSVKRKMTVVKALKLLQEEESGKLVNEDDIRSTALQLTEEQGIVFIDEIDKVVRSNHHGDVSREGVQRDLLPLLDGTVVNTRYGNVSTDYILFIASGAFMNSQPEDMLSELQGRLPIRVKLQSLTKNDFMRILLEPQNSLIKQYQELLKTEGVTLIFAPDAIEYLADLACIINEEQENIGARRLHTIIEKLLDELSFTADQYCDQDVTIDRAYVEKYVHKGDGHRDTDWIL